MKVSYREFSEFKDEFMRDPDPIVCFAVAFANRFPGLPKEKIDSLRPCGTVAQARVALDAMVEWVD